LTRFRQEKRRRPGQNRWEKRKREEEGNRGTLLQEEKKSPIDILVELRPRLSKSQGGVTSQKKSLIKVKKRDTQAPLKKAGGSIIKRGEEKSDKRKERNRLQGTRGRGNVFSGGPKELGPEKIRGQRPKAKGQT